MSDVIELERAHAPWAPSESADEVVVLDHYDMPLVGLLRQYGAIFVYACAAGEELTTNVWAYAHVDEGEAQRLVDEAGSPDFDELLAGAFHNRHVVVALADQGRLSGNWEVLESKQDSLLSLFRRYVNAIQERLDRLNADSQASNAAPDIADNTDALLI